MTFELFNLAWPWMGLGAADVHRGTYIRVSEKFLHILWCCTAAQHIAGVGVPQHVKKKSPQTSERKHYRAADEA